MSCSARFQFRFRGDCCKWVSFDLDSSILTAWSGEEMTRLGDGGFSDLIRAKVGVMGRVLLNDLVDGDFVSDFT